MTIANGLKPIETVYKGYRFRSRLEARWAVFFDTLGIAWEYEKEGYDLGEAGWYLPDFWLPEFECFVEIKGAEIEPESNDYIKCLALSDQSRIDVFIAQGQIGDHVWASFATCSLNRSVSVDPKCNVFKSELDYFSGSGLACPVCGSEYVSIHGTEGDGWKTPLTIAMQCESWHNWKVRFGFSKGNTFFEIIDATEGFEVAPDEFWESKLKENGSRKTIKDAYAAARSARFEHGEKGTR